MSRVKLPNATEASNPPHPKRPPPFNFLRHPNHRAWPCTTDPLKNTHRLPHPPLPQPQTKSLPFPACDVTTPPPQSLVTPESDQENWHVLSSCLKIHTDILASPLTPHQSTALSRRLFHFWLLLLACVPEVEKITEDLQRLEILPGGHPLETYLELNAQYTDEEKAEFYVRRYVKVSPYFLWLRRQGAGGVVGLNVGREAVDRILEEVEIRGAEVLGGLEKAREVLLAVAKAHVEFTVGPYTLSPAATIDSKCPRADRRYWEEDAYRAELKDLTVAKAKF
ncbi:hypothetical protein B9Z19DRAFT_1135380 [Tuber borchii]|uniref:Uncharacterized protein n=1 Tax=Tuber borchii TaxID=42251 RepID=A0A2T6ZCV6_TUBBO|nr:hypothetical protein B9Z19DRAFT_1135380 [Tuber borchii]